MRSPLRFAPPRLQDGEELERHATWLELFFDLVFVVAVAELVHDLSGDVTGLRLLGFVGLFVPVFLVWMNFSYYADLFGERGVDRAAIFLAMLGVAVLSTTLHDALAGSITNFALVYVALRVLLVALYARAWRSNPAVGGFLGRYVGLYALGGLFWLAALAFEGELRYALVGVGIAVEVATPATTYFTAPDRPTQVSHMPERFGLFTIIVLGEVVVAVVSGLADAEWSLPAVAAAVAAFLLAVALWRLYFADVRETTISEILRSDEFDFLAGMGYTYGHFGVTLGIGLTGAGALLSVLAVAEGGGLALVERLVLGGGVAVYLLGTSVTHGAVGALSRRDVAARGLTVLAVLVAAVLGPGPLVLMLLVAAVVAGLALLEMPFGLDGPSLDPAD